MTFATIQEALERLDDWDHLLKLERRGWSSEQTRRVALERFIPDRLAPERRKAIAIARGRGCTMRSEWSGDFYGARELLGRGYSGGTLLTLRDAGEDCHRFEPREIGYLAQWSVSDSERGGLKRIRWQPMPEHLKQRGADRCGCVCVCEQPPTARRGH